MLRVENLRKSFTGHVAVADVSFELVEGKITSIIGTNGAGKTTLFNLLTGHLKPDSGEIFFKGKRITGLPPHRICKMGIGRSFQKANIFPRLSVFENIQVALMSWAKKSRNIFLRSKTLMVNETNQILENIGLNGKQETQAGLLAYGDQRLLEIGITLGSHPDLVLLDEPTAGMSPEESKGAVKLVQKIAQEMNLTVLFIEHDMNVVFGISERVRVMHLGRIFAEGTPEQIRANKDVQKIYLAEEN